jgi:tetratricopeptide (TPR) repeat protein
MSARRNLLSGALLVFAACATTTKDAAKDVKVANPGPANEGGPAKAEGPTQPEINSHAKRLYEDANTAFAAQKKAGKFDYPALQRKYQAALDADPNLAEADYNLGVIADRQGNKDEAIAHYKSALNRKSSLREAAENLAVISQNAGNVQEATRVYTQLADTYPDDGSSRARLAELARQGGDCDKGLDLAKQALAREPKSLIAYKVMMACYAEKKQLSMAKLIGLRAIKLDDSDPELYFNMGVILAAEKEPEKALLQFKKALEVRGDYLPAHVVMAKISMDKENYVEAEEHLRKMLQVDPKNAALHLDLGVAYKGEGQYDKALQEYDTAEKIDPNLAAIYFNRGVILHRFKNQPQAAIELYKKYIAMNGAAIQDHPVNGLLNEAQQLIEAEKQAKEQEAQQKQMEQQKKQEDEKAKQDADKQKTEKAKGGVAGDAAANQGSDEGGAPASGDKPAAKAPPGGDKSTNKAAAGGRGKPAPADNATQPSSDAPPPAAKAAPAPKAAPPPAEAKPAAKPASPSNTDEPKDAL